MSRYTPHMTKVEVMALLTPWLDRLAHHDCDSSECQIDALIDANRELGRELGKQDAEIIRLGTNYQHALNTIVALRAEVARLKASRPRTPVEKAVDILSPRYHGDA